METIITTTGAMALAGGIWLIKRGGLTACIEQAAIALLVWRDMRRAAQAARGPARERWGREING